MLQTKCCRGNYNKHFVTKKKVFFIRVLYKDDVEKYCGAVQAMCDNMAHAHCLLDNYDYTFTDRMSNLLLFRCNCICKNTHVKLQVHSLTCLIYRYFKRNVYRSDQIWWLQWSVTPQSYMLWPHSVSFGTASRWGHSGMISCPLGKGYADWRVRSIDKVICCLAACEEKIHCTKSTSASQSLNNNTTIVWTVATVQCRDRKVAGSIPDVVIGNFHWRKIFPIALWSWGRLSP